MGAKRLRSRKLERDKTYNMYRDLTINEAIEALRRHEGFRQHPYRCTAGKLTVGYGLNLDDRGIYEPEARWLLAKDVGRIYDQLHSDYIWFRELDCDRRAVIINMVFNLGLPGFLKFRRMIGALIKKNYDEAADEMLDSKWATQVGDRAKELAEIMRLS